MIEPIAAVSSRCQRRQAGISCQACRNACSRCGSPNVAIDAALTLLAEGSTHAYRMRQLITERGVELVVNVRSRSGLHAAIARLVRDELIRVHAVERDSRTWNAPSTS